MNMNKTTGSASDKVAAFIDCSSMRLGDRMACAWFAQQRSRATGERFAILDRHAILSRDFPLPRYFPKTFADWSEALIASSALPEWKQGNLWLTVSNEFARHPEAGHFEYLPESTLALAASLGTGQGKRPRVLIHVLDDAQYNFPRRWRRSQANALRRTLLRMGCEVILLNPSPGKFIGDIERMLAEMLAADLFIGGDTGPSHVFASLCPEKPQIAIYPSMKDDQETYAAEQARLGLPLPWNSLPKRPDLCVIEMKAKRTLMWRGWKPALKRLGCFDAQRVAHLARAALSKNAATEAGAAHVKAASLPTA